MEIFEIDNQAYKNLVNKTFCRFNTAKFYELNAHKVDEGKYLLFNNGKDKPETDALCPINFINYNIFKYYKQNVNFKIVDIGISTEDSQANFGLYDFKESIGCQCSSKVTMIKIL